MKFPRQPRFHRAERPAPMVLTARDAEILRVVQRHRYLRSHQIAALIGGSRQQLLRRLQKLYHHGHLERPACQLDYFQRGGSRSIAYGLNRRGAVKRLFLDHALMISDIMVTLELACRKRGDVRLLLDDEIPRSAEAQHQRDLFRWTVPLAGQQKIGVIPDRVFALEFTVTRERVLCFLEADRGTMPIQRTQFATSCFARKFAAYAETWRQRFHITRFCCKRLRVLAVTESAERADHLRSACATHRQGRGIFLFSTRAEVINASDSLGAPWRNAGNETSPLAM